MALNDVPQSTQTLAQTQAQIRQNFINYINTEFAVDHQEFNTPNGGLHKKVSLLQPADSSIPSVTADGWVVFPAIPDTTFNMGGVAEYPITLATQELNIRKEGSVPIIPITAKSASSSEGWFYLPSGILYKWKRQGVGGSQQTITFDYSAIGPAYTNVYFATPFLFTASLSAAKYFANIKSLSATQTVIILNQATPAASDLAAGILVIGV